MNNEYSQLEQTLAGTLTAETAELLPYLPYLLQDIWELGSNPADMISLVKDNIKVSNGTKVIDLGCGKGAVAVSLAEELGIWVKGIDLFPEFIEEARAKAEKYIVNHLCEFAVQDINESVKTECEYDIAILGAVGDALGDPAETLNKLKSVVRRNGYILLDEAYLDGNQEDVRYQNYEYLTLKQWKKLFLEMHLELTADRVCENTAVSDEINAFNNRMIKKRAVELAQRYPDRRDIFEGYVRSQEMECYDLDNVIVGITWLLKKL